MGGSEKNPCFGDARPLYLVRKHCGSQHTHWKMLENVMNAGKNSRHIETSSLSMKNSQRDHTLSLPTTWVLNTLMEVELGRDRHNFSVNSVTDTLITSWSSLSASGSRVAPGRSRGMVCRLSAVDKSADDAFSELYLMTTPQIKAFSCVKFTTAVMAWELTTAGF